MNHTRDTGAVAAVAGAPSARPGRSALLIWWALSLGCLLSGEAGWFGPPATIVPGPTVALLAPDWSWDVPLGAWGPTAAWRQVPGWLAAIGGSLLTATIVRSVAASSGVLASILAIGLSLTMLPRDLVPGALILAIAAVQGTPAGRSSGIGSMIAYVGIAIAAVASTLEFGLVWCLAVFAALSDRRDAIAPHGARSRPSPWQSSGAAIGLVVIAAALALAVLHRGFLSALLRPVSWIWVRPDPRLLPSCGAACQDWASVGSQWGLAAFHLLVWISGVVSRALRRRDRLLLLALSGLGFGCQRHLWIATFALACLMPMPDWSPRRATRWLTPMIVVCWCFWLGVRFRSEAQMFHNWWNQSGTVGARVEMRAWRVSGATLWMNLDHADAWSEADVGGMRRPLATDRWDLFGEMCPAYAQVCRDLGEVRHESYLLSDGTWGGYLAPLAHWKPELAVVDASDLVRIRSMSLSPDWRLLGIDHRHVAFGRAESPATRLQARQTMQILANLEWPVAPRLDPQVIACVTPGQRSRVARVLCALRLPYAALRVLPSTMSPHEIPEQVECYLELAHRALRYTGRTSLLDQIRAVRGFERWSARSAWSTAERVRLGRGIDELRRKAVAEQTATKPPAPIVEVDDALPGEQRPRDALSEARLSADRLPSEPQSASSAPERRLRAAIASGDVALAANLLPELERPASTFYALLISSGEQPALPLYEALQRLVATSSLSTSLGSEAAFYLACLATELGDADNASRWLLESRRLDPHAVWEPLRKTYASQLGVR